MARTPYAWAFQAEATSDRLNSGPLGYYDTVSNVAQSAITTGGSHAISGLSSSNFIHTNRIIQCDASITVTNSGSACRYTVELVEGATAFQRIGDVTSAGSGDIAFVGGTGFEAVGTAATKVYSVQLTIQSGSGYSLAIATTSPAGGMLTVQDIGSSQNVT